MSAWVDAAWVRDRGLAVHRHSAQPFRGLLWLLCFIAVRRVQIEVNTAERAVAVILAQHDGDMPVQRDAMAQTRRAILEGGDCLAHQRLQAFEKLVGRFLHADDEFVVIACGGGHLLLEIFNL